MNDKAIILFALFGFIVAIVLATWLLAEAIAAASHCLA